MESTDVEALMWSTACLLALAAGVVLAWQAINRARVGAVRLRVRRRRGVRRLVVGAALALGAGVLAISPAMRNPPAIALLALSVSLLALSPGFQDSVWGARGVQRGWYARRFSQLSQWRLVGEHLRWKLFGDWVASDVPPDEHAALRIQLENEAPGREALHGNAGLDPQRVAATKSNS